VIRGLQEIVGNLIDERSRVKIDGDAVTVQTVPSVAGAAMLARRQHDIDAHVGRYLGRQVSVKIL